MDVRAILCKKRDGGELDAAEIEAFIGGYSRGEIPDYQASALLMAIFMRGMQEDELLSWTRAMLASGTTLDLAGIEGPKADKHSTGGVGDKVSLPLAPAVAACGVKIPMVSGRGLGHTGGTLDKLETIPGFRTALSLKELRNTVERVGACIAGQTDELVPADRKLYALRDVTSTVESIPLIASSIMSKKLAEGLDALVLDVKYGSGAFLGDPERGAELARTMLRIAAGFGLEATVYQTSMEQPLGRAIGNALEVTESIECLRGAGPADLRELVELLGGELVAACGVVADLDSGRARIRSALDDGSALAVFESMIKAQGGDARILSREQPLKRAPDIETIEATRSGILRYEDCRALGEAVCALGGGRRLLEDRIDPAVGLVALARAGDDVRAGQALFEVHHRAGHGLDEAREALGRAFALVDEHTPRPLVLRRL